MPVQVSWKRTVEQHRLNLVQSTAIKTSRDVALLEGDPPAAADADAEWRPGSCSPSYCSNCSVASEGAAADNEKGMGAIGGCSNVSCGNWAEEVVKPKADGLVSSSGRKKYRKHQMSQCSGEGNPQMWHARMSKSSV